VRFWRLDRTSRPGTISTSPFPLNAKIRAIHRVNVAIIPKIVGGYTAECQKHALSIYGRAIKTLVPVESCRVAGAVKLTENIFRAVNIAMVNELKVVYCRDGYRHLGCHRRGEDQTIRFHAVLPWPRPWGHCIPIDPFYLTWKARQYGQETRFIELAGEMNTAMPDYVIQRVGEALASGQKTISGSRILMIGIAYKANVDDDRESPAYVLWEKLERRVLMWIITTLMCLLSALRANMRILLGVKGSPWPQTPWEVTIWC